jgi:hypothetical protein
MEKRCFYCHKKIPPKKVILPLKDFKKLKVGSYVISKNGVVRKVMEKGRVSISLTKIGYSSCWASPYTVLMFNDVKNRFKVYKL